MRLHFLGGASEVGASCTLLEVAGKRLLIDAGMRMNRQAGSALPELGRLQEVGAPDAILVTHAHTDHIGALPVVYLGFPQAPIYCNEPTKALTKVLLADSLRIMESRWEQEEEIPLYPPHAVEGMLARMQTVPVGQPMAVCEGITATYIPAGHILGACSIMLDTPEGLLWFAGDYSVDRQQTVEGITLPKERPDLVVSESTYGNRIHSNRRQEEERLVAAVAAVVAEKGKVLIPSFALGRAQEVILLLLAAQRRGHIPKFPVYVDGMVKTMCLVYTAFPEFLTPALRRAVETSGTPFFYPGGAQPVLRTDRERIAQGQPCAIIASSGMLTGGPSRFYAEQLVDEPRNALFLTGYQDEESPGHHLLQLAQDVATHGEGLLRLDGVARRVRCKVARYGLSAHADGAQMLSVLCRVNPQHVVLVHGDAEARGALAQTFPEGMQVHQPANGQTLELAPFRRARPRPGLGQAVYGGLAGAGEPLDLAQLRLRLLTKDGPGRRYTVSELAQAWYGRPSPAQSEQLAGELARAHHCFAPDPHRPFLFTPLAPRGRAAAAFPGVPAQPAGKPGKVKPVREENRVLQAAQKLFEAFPDYEKAGTRPEQKTLILHFDFPEKAYAGYAQALAELGRLTGWAVEVSPKGNHLAVQRVAREAFPLTWDIAKVSIFQQEPRVRVRVRAGPGPVEPVVTAAQGRFLEVTGKTLDVELLPDPAPPQTLFDERARMEQNAAHTRIRQALGERGLALLSFSKKGDPPYLELGLLTPALAAAHQDLLEQLAAELGWELRTRPGPNQQALVTRARQLLPLDWLSRAEPAVFLPEQYLRFSTWATPDPARVLELSVQLERETGFRLTLVPQTR